MIEEVIDHIGQLNDAVDKDRWAIAEAVHDAYAEFEPYKNKLTAGLVNRCKLSTTQLYTYRDAWTLKAWYGGSGLSVSHYAKMHKLANEYKLTPGDIMEYFDLAKSEGMSVVKMAQEIENNHDQDAETKEQKTFDRMVKLMRTCWTLPVFNDVPEELRHNYYEVLKGLEDYAEI